MLSRILLRLAYAALCLVALAAFLSTTLPPFGAAPRGQRLAQLRASPHSKNGKFQNLEPTREIKPGQFWPMLRHSLFGHEQRIPTHAIPTTPRVRSDYTVAPASGLRATWLGHATTLVEIEGQRVLFDPMFSERCSPVSFLGPKRFFASPLPLSQLPHIDVVAISHDHYDHLDMDSIRALAAQGTEFVVPLGMGADLERWGVSPARISELDWYDTATIGNLRLIAAPARHYSGRGIVDRNRIEWASWAVLGLHTRVFFSGDSGYSDEFALIGRHFGPFDLTLIKIGASDPTWEQIHMSPEDAVLTHVAVRGKFMLPVHWGTFNLANHAWNEPAQRFVRAASASKITYAVPRPGEFVEPGISEPRQPWWQKP
jgi:L-ascorbate metabolism protein UlaG (beta-lactamase superfamily)